VVTPTYNHAAFIGPCIRSVLAQTLQDWEMVIVDDGSDDGTADIAESFHDPRIVVLRRQHEGVAGLSRAYALAMARATSPFVAILEGDDTWPTTKLGDQLPLFEDPAVVLAYGAAGLMDEKGCIYARFSHAPRGPVARNDPIDRPPPSTAANRRFPTAQRYSIRRSPNLASTWHCRKVRPFAARRGSLASVRRASYNHHLVRHHSGQNCLHADRRHGSSQRAEP